MSRDQGRSALAAVGPAVEMILSPIASTNLARNSQYEVASVDPSHYKVVRKTQSFHWGSGPQNLLSHWSGDYRHFNALLKLAHPGEVKWLLVIRIS